MADNESNQEDTEVTKPSIWAKFKQWWLTLTKEEWELTIFFPGDTKILPDGTRIESSAPKTYRCTAIQKLTNTHIIFIDTSGIRHEINVVNPVGYDSRKIY